MMNKTNGKTNSLAAIDDAFFANLDLAEPPRSSREIRSDMVQAVGKCVLLEDRACLPWLASRIVELRDVAGEQETKKALKKLGDDERTEQVVQLLKLEDAGKLATRLTEWSPYKGAFGILLNRVLMWARFIVEHREPAALQPAETPLELNSGADTQKFSEAVKSVKCELTQRLLLARWHGMQTGSNKEKVLADFRKENSKQLGKTEATRQAKWDNISRRARAVIKPFMPAE